MSSLPLQPKKCLIFLDFPMKNVAKIFGIPMSSLGGVHLISGISQYHHGLPPPTPPFRLCSFKILVNYAVYILIVIYFVDYRNAGTT